jgi:hypothetical protein
VAGSCEHGNEPFDSIKGGKVPDYRVTISFSRRTLLHGLSRLELKNAWYFTSSLHDVLT